MRIESVASVLPSRAVTNTSIADMVRERSMNFQGDLDATLGLLCRMLGAIGAHTRLWLAENECPRELTIRACKEAMRKAGHDIDLIIFSSVWNDIYEPSFANTLAFQLGLDRVECFDLKAGCDGWMKAARLAEMMFAGGDYKRIMVVNAEFNVTATNTILPLFTLGSPSELERKFPAFTIGEVTTATILSDDGQRNWKWAGSTRNLWADLCTVTAPHYRVGSIPSMRIAPDGTGLFTSFGADMLRLGGPEASAAFRSLGVPGKEFRHIFTHSSSERDWRMGLDSVEPGISKKMYAISRGYGNVVSASIPAALSAAIEAGDLQRGDPIALANGSAGMTFSAAFIPSY